jgi:hypothetical protein
MISSMKDDVEKRVDGNSGWDNANVYEDHVME